MTTTNSIVPPPELVEEWWNDALPNRDTCVKTQLCTQAAQWGADQELEACCLLLDDGEHAASYGCHNGSSIRAARRPKPPSLKEQALEALQFVDEKLDLPLHNHCNAIHTIRRALEQL